MPDCPQSLSDFHRRFPSEADCAAWLFAVRWPDGFRCPACGHGSAWALRGKGPHLRVRRLRPSDLGDGGDSDARLEAYADDVVSSGLADGDAHERLLGAADARATG